MRQFTDVELKDMDLETAEAEIQNAVYDACRLFEQLELAGRKVRGNGHHIRQNVAGYARDMMRERWKG